MLYIFLEKIPAEGSALCCLNLGTQAERGSQSPTSTNRNMANCKPQIPQPQPWEGHRTLLYYFTSHHWPHSSSPGGRERQSYLMPEVGNEGYLAESTMPTTDRFMDKYHEEKSSGEGDWVSGYERRGKALCRGSMRAEFYMKSGSYPAGRAHAQEGDANALRQVESKETGVEWERDGPSERRAYGPLAFLE